MRSDSPRIVGPATRTTGAVDVVQGVYGSRGNLELIACDAVDGLWVFWFNADDEGDAAQSADVGPGAWSAGLHFAAGTRYTDARILQSAAGPDHLEVLARDAEGVLQSWYWSPGPGFQRRATDAATDVADVAVAHDEGTLALTVVGRDGRPRHLVSSPQAYPSRIWLDAPDGPPLASDATDEIVAAGVAGDRIVPGTPRRAPSTRRGGTTELTWRDVDGGIRHLGVPSAPERAR